ncbi:hypothetical protein Tco_1364273, partial [Tanacetum coccineum]
DAHKVDECDSNETSEHVCLPGGDIYDDPSLLRLYQNDDLPLWGNSRKRMDGEEGSDWVTRSQFEDKLANFILEKSLHAKGVPFLSRLKNQKKDDEDEKFLSIFKHIHINLPFLEVVFHMLKEAKVLKDLLSHKGKLEKVASSVKLSEECSTVIQRNLP